jgi:hypothetical protein
MMTVFSIVLGIIVVLVVVNFSRALAVKTALGKWPHESGEAMALFKELP